MYLQLDDNENLSGGFLRGLTAVATGGASELVRGATKGKNNNPVCSCDNEKNIIQKLTKQLRARKKDNDWGYKNRKIIYNPNTGIAKITTLPKQETLADSLIGSVIGATPYGAVAKGALNIGKSLLGKKSSTSTSVDTAKIKGLEESNKKLSEQIKKTQTTNKSLKMQRYYYGAGGAVLGFGLSKLIK